jgi:uncharacterized protein
MSRSQSYYVYALKDPRSNPARPFYIGKGTGVRAEDHLVRIDETSKGRRISQILADGRQVLVVRLVEGLSESEALKIEAELISAFGVESQGGLLTNSVVPIGKIERLNARQVSIPSGAIEKAQIGLGLLKDAIFELASANESGVTNSDIVHAFNLHSDYSGGSKDYLTWSILGLLMRENKLERVDKKRHRVRKG